MTARATIAVDRGFVLDRTLDALRRIERADMAASPRGVDLSAIVDALRRPLPDVQAIYVFGSVARGDGIADSDLDIALLCPRPLPSTVRWELQERLAALAHRNVDLVDLRAASAVFRVNVLDDGRLLYDGVPFERALFEATACADYARLQEERREILEQVARDGRVYG